MIARFRGKWMDWGLVIFLIGACIVLSALQYQWTGEIARAEMTRLRRNLADQNQRLCDAFDAEVQAACRELFVTRSELEELGRDTAYLQQLREWLSSKPRPIFQRMAVATFSEDKQQLFALDAGLEELAPIEWPADWVALKDHNIRWRSKGMGWYTFSDPRGTLLEFVMVSPRSHGAPAVPPVPAVYEWLILELDLDYVRNTWLPELVHTYVNLNGLPHNDVEVKTATAPVFPIFSTRDRAGEGGEPPAVIRFNRPPRGGRNSSSPQGEGRWIFESYLHPGALEAWVAGSRRRNLGVALALNLLILAAGLALIRHTRRSRQLAEAQMNFVANVSHELRTPLTVIQGAAQNLQRGIVNGPDRVGQYSSLIAKHADRLGELIEQVLEFASLKKRQTPWPPEPVSLTEVVNDAATAAASEAHAGGCEIKLDLPASLPRVSGDAPALRRVFHNLVANAIKHGAGGWVRISAVAPEGNHHSMVEVSVSDGGPGIPESERAHIFQPFFRGARAQETQTPGSGLGLSLAREIVEACGGSMSVSSTEGGGATFSVLLPVIKPAESS